MHQSVVIASPTLPEEAQDTILALGLGTGIGAVEERPGGIAVGTQTGFYFVGDPYDPDGTQCVLLRPVYQGIDPLNATSAPWLVAVIAGHPPYPLHDMAAFKKFAVAATTRTDPWLICWLLVTHHAGRPGATILVNGDEISAYLEPSTRIRLGQLPAWRPRRQENGTWTSKFATYAWVADETGRTVAVQVEDWDVKLVPGSSMTFAHTPRGRPMLIAGAA